MNYYRHYDDDETVSTSNPNIVCHLCGRDLSNAYAVPYFEGQLVCLICLAKIWKSEPYGENP